MKVSFTTMATPNLSGIEAIKLAKKFNFSGIDFRVSKTKGELTLNVNKNKIKKIKKELKSKNIKLVSLLCYNKTGDVSSQGRNKMKKSILSHLNLASQLNASYIRIFCGNPKDYKTENYINKTAKNLSNILSKNKSEVTILIQNHKNYTDINETLKIINKVEDSRLGLVFAPEHCIMENKDFSSKFNLIKKYCEQLYICDKKLNGSKYIDVLPGQGDVPIKKIYSKLGGKKFKGWITFKWERVWEPKLKGPQVSLPYFIKFCQRLTKD